jgi:hypothetical protein
MLKERIKDLRNKCSIVFNYLIAHRAIKVDREKFDTNLQEIERYFNDNDWILSEYWLDRIQAEYLETFLNKLTRQPT